VNFADDNTAVGTLINNSATISAGQSSNTIGFQPVSGGTANISLSSTPTGYTTPSNNQSTAFTVTQPNLEFYSGCVGYYTTTFSCTLGKDEQLGAFIPYLAAAAPAGGRNVTITSSDPTRVLLTTNPNAVGTASVTVNVAAGSYQGPTIYAQGLTNSGTVTITESAPAYNTASGTFTLVPTGFVVGGGTSTTTFSTVSLLNVGFYELNSTTFAAPRTDGYYGATLRPGASPVTVTLTDGSAAVGTLGSNSVIINAGQTGNSTTFQPLTAGTANISISATPTGYTTPSNGQSTAFTVTAPNLLFGGGCGGYSTTFSCNIGKDEQYGAFSPYLAAAAPAGGRNVTITSSDPTRVLLTTNPNAVGTASVIINIAAGSYSGPTVYAQALMAGGTVTITESTSGYNTATGTFTLVPTGFVVGGGTTTTTFSSTSQVNVGFYELDPTTFAAPRTDGYYGATLRTGALPITVNLTDSSSGVGTLGGNSVTVSAGQNGNSTTFQPVSAGTATISIAATPSNYTKPSNGQSTAFTVTAPNLYFGNACGGNGATFSCNLGKDEQYGAFVPELATGAPAGGKTVTVTSSDPSKVLLTTNPSAVGTASVTVSIAAGYSSGATIYAQGLATSGTVTITESTPGYNTATGTFTLVPTGFVVGGGTTTTTFSSTSSVNVGFYELDPTTLNAPRTDGYYGATLRTGASPITVSLTDSNLAVGTLSSNSVTISAGQNGNSTSFQPISAGIANIGIAATPSGYTTPSNGQITTFMVTAPNLLFGGGGCAGNYSTTFSCNLGKDEQYGAFIPYLAAAAPTATAITIASSDSSKVLLTTNPSSVGTASVTVNIAAGGSAGPTVYVQGLATAGTVTITESASGYITATGSFTLVPTGFVVGGGTTTTTFSSTSPVNIGFYELDPTTLNAPRTDGYYGATLRTGASPVTINLIDDNSGVGGIANNSLTISAAQTGNSTTFQPVSAGTANISIAATPANYTTPSNGQITSFTVTTPAVSLSSTAVGQNLETTAYVQLAIATPTATTVTSADSTKIVLSNSATAPGSGTLTISLAAGASQTPTFYVQSLSGAGTLVNISISVPGYSMATGTVTINPSGFVFSGVSDFTASISGNPITLTVVPSMLDPVYLTPTATQLIRPGLTGTTATIATTDQSGTSPIGTFNPSNQVVFNGADNPNSQTTSFVANNPGVTVLKITTAASGFTSASSQITATVTK
jgi:hypothetical protein